MERRSESNNLEAAQQNQPNRSRRDFVKKAGYVAPLILSFSAKPALAQGGSGASGSGSTGGGKGKGKGK
jgi:hypothetical protein